MHEYYNRLTDKVCPLPPLYNGQWELLYNYSTLFSFKSRGKTDGAMNFGFIEIGINFLSGKVPTYFLKNYLETHNFSHTLFCSYMILEGFPPPPEKDLESPSSTRLEALVPSRDSRART